MKYTRAWLDSELKRLYPSRTFTEKEKSLFLELLNPIVSFSDSAESTRIHSRKILLECKQTVSDVDDIISQLKKS